MEMSIGDVILTEAPASGNVLLCVEGERTYRAAIGQHKRMRALRVVGEVERPPGGGGGRRARPRGRARG
jgi:flagellar motor switch protein FliM